MKNTQNIAIVLLLCTAVILTALLLGSYVTTSQSARADASLRFGNYITCTGAYSKSTDLIYVLNIDQQMLNVYALDINKGVTELRDSIELDKYFSK